MGNYELSLNDFLDKFEEEEAGRADAHEHDRLKREKILAQTGELFGLEPGDVIALLTGVEGRAKANKAKAETETTAGKVE